METIDPKAWVAEAEGIDGDREFVRSPYFREQARFAERLYGVRSLGPGEVETSGFSERSGRGGDYWLAQVKPGGEPAKIEWTFKGPSDSARISHRIFVGMINALSDATGEERVRISHNGFVLGEFEPTRRRELAYAFPYHWEEADARGDVPMELSFEPQWQLFMEGFTTRERRMITQGDVITIEAIGPGSYGIRDFLLVPQANTMSSVGQSVPWFEIKDWQWGGHAGQLQFAWVTRHPARCILMWNTDREALEVGEGWTHRGERFAENHQFFIPNHLKPGETISARVLVESDDGQRMEGPIVSFTQPAEPEQEAKGELKLAPLVEPNAASGKGTMAMIPFAPGVLLDPSAFQLTDAETGNQIPAQAVVNSAYSDNSIRWLGVFFTPDQPGGDFVFRYGPGLESASNDAADGLEIQQDKGTIFVRSGETEWKFDSKKPGAIPDYQGEALFGLALESLGGEVFHPGPPSELKLEIDGPIHARVMARGHFQHGGEQMFEYILRWRFAVGVEEVDVEFTIGNDAEDPNPMYHAERTLTHFRNLYLDLPAGDRIEADLDGDWVEVPDGKRYFQFDENEVIALDGNRKEGRMGGRIRTAKGGIEVEDFWQQFPKSVEHVDDKLRLGLFPGLEGVSYEEWPVKLRQQLLFFIRDDDHYRIMAGKQKTHRLRFHFEPDSVPSPELTRVEPLGPALYAPPTEYAAATGVFGPLDPVQDNPPYPEIEKWFERVYNSILGNRESNREFGLLNFGDWFGERGVNWGNLEYDLGMAASAQFLRSNDPRWFTLGQQAASHQAEISTLQYGRNAGLQPQHAAGHTGREYFAEDGFLTTEDFQTAGWPRIPYNQSFHAGHMWSMGMANYASMTGCPRLTATVDLFGKQRSGALTYALNGQHHRGWNLLAFAGAYSQFGDPFFKNAGRITLDRYYDMVDPASGVVWPYSYEQPTIGATNRQAILFYGLLTGDERANDVFQRSLLTLHQTWDPDVEGITTVEHGWWAVRRADSNWALLMAEGYRQTGDERFLEMLKAHLRGAFRGVPNNTKDISSELLYAPYFSAALSAIGLEALPDPEVPAEVRRMREAGGRHGLQPPNTHPPLLRKDGAENNLEGASSGDQIPQSQ